MKAFALPALVLALLLALVPCEARAQDVPPGEFQETLIDRIAAVAGDSIVLLSQVQRRVAEEALRGRAVPEDPAALRELELALLDEMVDQLLLVQAALADSAVVAQVSDERVEDAFRQAWQEQISRFGGEAALREAVEAEGLTLPLYRASLRGELFRELLLRNYVQVYRSTARPLVVSDQEVREYFEREGEGFGVRPATITMRTLFVEPTASEEARRASRERAEEVLQMIRSGDDFAELARRLSDDEGSRMQGGDLGWHRRPSDLVPEFETAAFELREGQVSEVVETAYGAHIIKIERVRSGERRIRHILIAAERSLDDEGMARARAEEIAEAVRSGTPMRTFRGEAFDLGFPDSLTIARAQLDDFPPPMASAIGTAAPGETVGPVDFPVGEGLTLFAIVQILELRDEGRFTFEDVRDQLRSNLREERFQERIFRELRDQMFVDIRL